MMARSIHTKEGLSPVSIAVERLCLSLAQVFEKRRKGLALPYDRVESISAWLGQKAMPEGEDEDAADEAIPSVDKEA